MLSTFALAVMVGTNSVQGVAHSLHSPLMSITNAISGLTVLGGMLQLGGGVVPHTGPQALATGAVALSSVNLVGGFLITKKMLDMFRRPDDPPEYWHYYMLPPAVAIRWMQSKGVGLRVRKRRQKSVFFCCCSRFEIKGCCAVTVLCTCRPRWPSSQCP